MFFYYVNFRKIYQLGILFSITDFGSSHKKSFGYAGDCVRGYTRMWFNLYVR